MELSDQRQQGTVRETLTMTALTSRLAWAASFALAASFGAAQAQQTSITVGLQLQRVRGADPLYERWVHRSGSG